MTQNMTLSEVARDLLAKAKTLKNFDQRLVGLVRLVEYKLRTRDVRKLFTQKVVPGVSIGWSAKKGAWRLVLVDNEDDQAIPLLDADIDEIIEVVETGALQRLVAEATRS